MTTTYDFINRHIGSTVDEQKIMLDYLQCESFNQLLKETVPHNILQSNSNLDLSPVPEHEALKEINSIIDQNKIYKTYIGQGYYSGISFVLLSGRDSPYVKLHPNVINLLYISSYKMNSCFSSSV